MGAFAIPIPGVTTGIIGRPVTAPSIPSPVIDTSDWGSTIGSLIGTGLGAWQTDLQTNLLQSQINHNQAPSIVAGPNGTPSAGYSYTVNPQTGAITYAAGAGTGALTSAAGSILSSGFIWLIVIGLILVLALRR